MLQVSLDTGKKNQIRVQMQAIGHPISGDRKYGGHSSPIHRIALHARTLNFTHPITGKELKFGVSIPHKFHNLFSRKE
jgi:23S rRNA pseudouridine1911/1915/1917 synthase